MIASKAFGQLEELNVDDNALTDASKPKVNALVKKAYFGTRQDPSRAQAGHHRYCSVGE